jgi:hypothetical protein
VEGLEKEERRCFPRHEGRRPERKETAGRKKGPESSVVTQWTDPGNVSSVRGGRAGRSFGIAICPAPRLEFAKLTFC